MLVKKKLDVNALHGVLMKFRQLIYEERSAWFLPWEGLLV